MENINVTYDSLVRISGPHAQVIQFAYGEDGFDPMHLEHQTLYMYVQAKAAGDNGTRTTIDAHFAEWESMIPKSWMTATERALKGVLEMFPCRHDGKWYLPVRVEHFTGLLMITSTTPWSPFAPETYYDETYVQIRALLDRLSAMVDNSMQHILFEALIWDRLTPKLITQLYHASRNTQNSAAQNVDWLLSSIERMWHTARIQPGEKIGVIAAQSIGQLAMQTVLNSFHYSGVANSAVTTGFPRLGNLVTVPKQIGESILRLYMRPEYKYNEQMATRAARHIRYITLEDAVVSRQTTLGIPENAKTWMDLWMTVHAGTLDAHKMRSFMQSGTEGDATPYYAPYVGQLVLDRTVLVGVCTTIKDSLAPLARRIEALFLENIKVIASPMCMAAPSLLFFVQYEPQPAITEDQTNMNDDAFMKRRMDDLPPCVGINGVEGVSEAFVRGGVSSSAAMANDIMVVGGHAAADEYFIETSGGDLQACWSAAFMEIDTQRSYSNSPQYIENVLGVEAARSVLVNELDLVLRETSYVDAHHLSIVADCMTQTGKLRGITRHEQPKTRFSGPLDIATFEQGISVLTDAALNGRTDHLQGESARIATGRRPTAGTGAFSVVVPVN